MKSTEAINLALHSHLAKNRFSVCIGLGINDPKRIFGTTSGLVESYGRSRIIEPPTSENALTGICLGLCQNGFSVCLTHQRFDFALLSLDQIINSISKWKFMFGRDEQSLPLVIRLIVGRGWGQGPTHSQSYHSFLASIPGLNVVYPFNPETFYSAIFYGMKSRDPTIVVEHRWLHNVTTGNAPASFDESICFDAQPKKLSSGDSITIFTYGYLVPEVTGVLDYLREHGITVDLLVPTNLSKTDITPLYKSCRKTKRLLMLEPYSYESSYTCSIATRLFETSEFRAAIIDFKILSLPFEHESTSYFQTASRYIDARTIISQINNILGSLVPLVDPPVHHDVPGDWFKGPF